MTSGRRPARLASMAQASPVGPAPMQIKSYVMGILLVCDGRGAEFNWELEDGDAGVSESGFATKDYVEKSRWARLRRERLVKTWVYARARHRSGRAISNGVVPFESRVSHQSDNFGWSASAKVWSMKRKQRKTKWRQTKR